MKKNKNTLLGGLTFILVIAVKSYIFYETVQLHGDGSMLTFILSLCVLISIYAIIYKCTKNMIVIVILNILINGAMIADILYNKYIASRSTDVMVQMVTGVMTQGALTFTGLFYLVMDGFLIYVLSYSMSKKDVTRLTDKES